MDKLNYKFNTGAGVLCKNGTKKWLGMVKCTKYGDVKYLHAYEEEFECLIQTS